MSDLRKWMTGIRLFCLSVFSACLLVGCAAENMPGYVPVYESYRVPDELITQIRNDFGRHGLANADVKRDMVGRVQLTGSFATEDDVDLAYTIITAHVGQKATSPFYPADIKKRHIEEVFKLAGRKLFDGKAPGVKRALIIGIGHYKYSRVLTDTDGALDAQRVALKARDAGFEDVTVLLDEQATKNRIETAVNEMAKRLRKNDTLLLFISAHGLPPHPTSNAGDQRSMSVAAYDTGYAKKGGKPVDELQGADAQVRLYQTSIPDRFFLKFVSHDVKTRRVILDTCYSGNVLGIDNAFIRQNNNGQTENANANANRWLMASSGIRPKAIYYDNDAGYAGAGSKSSSAWKEAAKNRDFIVITASAAGEKSYSPKESVFNLDDGTELRGSYFTQSFMHYLDKHGDRIIPAFTDATKLTESKAMEKGIVVQHPQMAPYTGDDSVGIY